MKSRLDDIPTLREIPSVVQASHFNIVRRSLLRLGPPLRVELKGLRHLDMLFDDDTWVCVDRALNDLPVVAWTDFRKARSSLNEPVHCRLKLFHAHAGIILNHALEIAERILTTYLNAENADAPHDVSVLKRPRGKPSD